MLQPYVYQGEHAESKMTGKDKPCVTHSQTRIAPIPMSILHDCGASPPKVQVN